MKDNQPHYNEIIIDKELFETQEEFTNYIGRQMIELTRLGYEVSLYYDDCDIYIMRYVHDENTAQEYGAPQFMILDQDEVENVLRARQPDVDENDE